MTGPCCCEGGARPGVARRLWGALQWLTPAAMLALIPKCPVCLAAYVALWTGLGLSVTTATYVRLTLIGLCLGSLAYLAFTRLARLTRALRT